MSTCRCLKCGTAIDVIEIDDKDMNTFTQLTGRMPTIIETAYCARCIETQEQQDAAKEEFARVQGFISSRRWACDLTPYGTPWSDAETNNPEAWAFAREWRPRNGNVFLCGPEGVGKTAMARYMLWRAYEKNKSVAEISAFRLPRLHYPEDTFEMYAGVYVLLVDDVSAVEWTDRHIQGLKELIEVRNDRQRCTIFTSQYTASVWHAAVCKAIPDNAALADSIVRRLRPFKEIEMKGNSLRKLLNYGDWALVGKALVKR